MGAAILPDLTPEPPPGVPDDWAFDRDLPCPKCRYNLRMLRAPRCPECGTIFRWQTLLATECPRCGEPLAGVNSAECPRCRLDLDWAALLRGGVPLHGGLYEYTDRPRRAAIRAAFAVLRPRRFWRRIPLELPPMPLRLARYQRLAWSAGIIGLTIATSIQVLIRLDVAWLIACAFPVGLPLVTRVALPRFTPTLAKFTIRRDQLQRCFVYASTGVGWIGVTFGLMLTAGVALRGGLWWWWPPISVLAFPEALDALLTSRWARSDLEAWLNAVVGAVFWSVGFIWWWRFLYVALRHYLRLNAANALALFLCTQGIAVLLVTLIVAQLAILGYLVDAL